MALFSFLRQETTRSSFYVVSKEYEVWRNEKPHTQHISAECVSYDNFFAPSFFIPSALPQAYNGGQALSTCWSREGTTFYKHMSTPKEKKHELLLG